MDKTWWHPAFCGATEWELKDNKNDLEFDSEYNLSKKPLQMDMLVVKKNHNVDIVSEIGRILGTTTSLSSKVREIASPLMTFTRLLGMPVYISRWANM